MVPIDSTARAGRWPGDTPITPTTGGPGGSPTRHAPLISSAPEVTFVDIDDTVRSKRPAAMSLVAVSGGLP